jgi:glycosyltransferase involved in cell wall biosynthesis
MKVIFACGREISYPRNRLIFQSISHFATVYPIFSNHHSLFYRLSLVAYRLLKTNIPHLDAYFIGFFGQPLVFLTRVRWKGPLILDAFVSAYDTLCFDRKVFSPKSPLGLLTFYLDRLSCHLADVVIVDTQAQARYFQQTFQIPEPKIQVIYAGCDDDLFRPLEVSPNEVPIILFYGTFLPLHGIDIIIQAAYQLRSERLLFQLIGHGQEYEKARFLVSKLKLNNVQFLPPVPLETLPLIINRATICLGGPFGRSSKAQRVITSKTFQCLAAGKPTIVGETPANKELFTHSKNVWMCPVGNPDALANSIRILLDSPDLCAQLGKAGREIIQQTSGKVVTTKLVQNAVEKARCFYRGRLQ